MSHANYSSKEGSHPLTAPSLRLIRIPVSDIWASKDWYTNNFDLMPLFDEEEEDQAVGSILRHELGFFVGLHRDPQRAAVLAGFAVLGLEVPGRPELDQWIERFDRRGVAHGPVVHSHLGWLIELPDPDGIMIRLHCGEEPYAEEA